MPETDFKYDVFVSYSSANKEWVRKTFVPILEKAGLRTCDYYRDFDPGAPIVKEMERAILESRKTILVLSPEYLASGWTEFESLMLQTLDAANQERRLLPVIYGKCDLPLRFRYMNCINFDNPDDAEIEWQRLSKALGVTLSPSLLDPKLPDSGSRDTWHLAHPYPMPPNFTGRVIELKMLDDWLCDNTNHLFILRALGGFGKSALTWQWMNTRVNPADWTKLAWWSFYEGDASFEHFIEETLKYLKLEVPQGQRPQVDALLKAMQSQKILLIMDGFERALRAYSSMNAAYQGDEIKLEDNQLDCVNINAEFFLKGVCSLPNIKSKVLITTRLTPRAIKPHGELMLGCHEEELTSLQPADAVKFFHKQKIKGTRTEIEAACAPYGYHPLSLRLLAGRILKDFENPADIVVAQKLKIGGDLRQHQHHVLEVSYNSLPSYEQKLLSTIACFRSPVELKTLQVITENKDTLDNDLHDLVERGLLHFDEKNKKFDLHPIVRRHAYERLTSPDRTTAHASLRDYFAAVDVSAKTQTLDDLTPVIELYHHTARAGSYDNAYDLFYDRLNRSLYFQFGAYQVIIYLLQTLFIDGESKPPRLKKENDQAVALNQLANAISLSGQPRQAVPLYEGYISLSQKGNDKKNEAIGLGAVASVVYLPIGALHAAERNHRRRIDLSQEIQDIHGEAIAHRELGRVLSYRGMWDDAKQEFAVSYKLFEQDNNIQSKSVVMSWRTELILMINRNLGQSSIENRELAITYAQDALELAKEQQRSIGIPIPRDFIRANLLLGVAYSFNGELNLAERHLSEALVNDRAINMVDYEANILLGFAILSYKQKKYDEAKSLAEEALLITERCGYVLQGADVNLFLAQYTLEQEQDKTKAKQYAEEAKKLATCDGPPYYYKVAYEEAERMLEKLK